MCTKGGDVFIVGSFVRFLEYIPQNNTPPFLLPGSKDLVVVTKEAKRELSDARGSAGAYFDVYRWLVVPDLVSG